MQKVCVSLLPRSSAARTGRATGLPGQPSTTNRRELLDLAQCVQICCDFQATLLQGNAQWAQRMA